MKICTLCHASLTEDLFGKMRGSLNSRCKPCLKVIEASRRLDPEYRERQRLAAIVRYHSLGPLDIEKKRIKARIKYQSDQTLRERLSLQRKEKWKSDAGFRQRSIDAQANRNKSQEVKAKRSAYYIEYNRSRISENPKLKIDRSIGCALARFMRDRKSGRRWESVLGYSLDELVAHLEKQFIDGMSWENYGTKWHIDHILPKSIFESATDNDVISCWGLPNLRPLWADENHRKSNKRTFLL